MSTSEITVGKQSDRVRNPRWIALILGLFIGCGALVLGTRPVQGQPASAEATATDQAALKKKHQGKAGVYGTVRSLTIPKMDENLLRSHPLLDAVVINVAWHDVEPTRGTFTFDLVRDAVQQWAKAGKGVVIKIVLYGQDVDDRRTPAWIYAQPGVREVHFKGGGDAKGKSIRIPAVWDPGFVETNVAPMVQAFAKAFDGHPGLWYVVPSMGHQGHITAQPSKDGCRGMLEAGWTPSKWMDYGRRTVALYRKSFRQTPLFLVSEGSFIRDMKHNKYKDDAAKLLGEFGNQGVAMTHFNFETVHDQWKQTIPPVFQDFAPIMTAAQAGRTRIGVGDDWPMWVPEKRRQAGPTLGRDDAYFRKALEYAFGGLDGLPPMPTTIFLLQTPEIQASHPGFKDHHPPIAAILAQARQRLKKTDAAIFTK